MQNFEGNSLRCLIPGIIWGLLRLRTFIQNIVINNYFKFIVSGKKLFESWTKRILKFVAFIFDRYRPFCIIEVKQKILWQIRNFLFLIILVTIWVPFDLLFEKEKVCSWVSLRFYTYSLLKRIIRNLNDLENFIRDTNIVHTL